MKNWGCAVGNKYTCRVFQEKCKNTRKMFPKTSKQEKIPKKVYNRSEQRLFRTYRKKSEFVSFFITLKWRLLDAVYILWGGKYIEFKNGFCEN